MAQKVSTYMSNFLNRVFTNVYLILVLQLVSLYSTSLSADSNEKLILPVDLTKLNWYAKQGFAATDASQDQTIDPT